jgi:hypothetical protein
VIVAITVVALDAFKILDLKKLITWPLAVAALFWFYGAPLLLWRTNAGGRCGWRMEVKLRSGKAPR